MNVMKMIFGERAALVYLAVFAVAIGVATFVENDYGTSSAQYWIYQAFWFELLLALFTGSLIYNAIYRRLWQRKQYAVLLFHLSMVVILIGSGITRMFGYEGMVHIREGQTSSQLVSREMYLTVSTSNGSDRYVGHKAIWPSSLGKYSWKNSFESPLAQVTAEVLEVVPQPAVQLSEDGGQGAMNIVFGSSNGRVERTLVPGEQTFYGNIFLKWLTADELPQWNAVSFRLNQGVPQVWLPEEYQLRVMATGEEAVLESGQWHDLKLRSLYRSTSGQFVISQFEQNGSIQYVSAGTRIESGAPIGMRVALRTNSIAQEVWLMGADGAVGTPEKVELGGILVECALGSIVKPLPFSLALEDFEMTRYPGTDAAATFASDVILTDEERGEQFSYNIHMNHILDYRGYRFFQSSYDQDEMGSYLSVNHDFWGTWVTYIGYILLTLGMIWALFAKGTRFEMLWRAARGKSKAVGIVILMLSTVVASAEHVSPSFRIDESHASKVSELYVQDFRGRMKPMHTLSREVLRKISGHEEIEGMSADAFILAAFFAPEQWYGVPMINVGKSDLVKKVLGVTDDVVSYKDCFDEEGSYKLAEWVREAQSKRPTEKNANDKAVISLDERVNIMNMIFGGHFLKWIPQAGDENNLWVGPTMHGSRDTAGLAQKFFGTYASALYEAQRTENYEKPDALLAQLAQYQRDVDLELLPSDSQRSAEILLNNVKPFNRLSGYYGLLAFVFLVFLFLDVFLGAGKVEKFKPFLFALAVLLFVMHTAALGLRWYVSERAPWSNGYESLIYIGWTSVLAGVLFSRKDWGAMAATLLLASTVLLISMLSFLNPEITPLVPVLKSYWLTIHVSLEAGSYGFLMLGAIIGVINLLLMSVSTQRNFTATQQKIKRLTAISELTVTGGLYMLSIGTYLGGVWANESWGRYWGWDAKETWALVSILVYAFILHMRFIPALRSAFAFNVGTQFGLASVIMTYFGVNYYLSGLHSYAAGDPIPIPNWVYISTASLVVLIVFAGWRQSVTKKKMKAGVA